jgi:hypothetical protein
MSAMTITLPATGCRGLGKSLAATIPGVAQSSRSSPKTQPLEDPAGKYPKPPFNKSVRPDRFGDKFEFISLFLCSGEQVRR